MSRSVLDKINGIIKEAVAPAFCVQCGSCGGWLCSTCAEQILFIKEQTCYRCRKLSDGGRTCSRCWSKTDLGGVTVATHYEAGPVREMVHKLKYEGMAELAELLSQIGYQGLKYKSWLGWVIMPVPLYRTRLMHRGFNQADLIGRRIARELRTEYFVHGLRRVRSTDAQVKLTGNARRANVYRAFQSTADLRGVKVLLVDDVMTTGATLEDCARACKDAGARQVWATVIARG